LVFIGPTPYQAGQTSLAISPDGRRIVYLGTHAGTTGLYVRDLNDYGTRLLAGTDRAFGPFFSPDGRSIGFFVGSELKRIDVAGGPVTTLAGVDLPTGAAWQKDGYILVSDRDGRRLLRVRETGGAPEPIHSALSDRRNFPELLPGTPYVLHSNQRRLTATNVETGKLFLISPDGPLSDLSATNQAVIRGTEPRYLSAGYLTWLSPDGVLLAARFDARALRFRGPTLVIASGVRRESSNGAGQFAITNDGILAYVTGVNADVGHLAWVSEGGHQDSLPFAPGMYGTTDISPDGRRMIGQVTQTDGRREEWMFDFARGVAQNLSGRDAFQFSSVARWTPDSKSLVYGATPSLGGAAFIVRVSPDRPGVVDTLGRGAMVTSATFTPSGDTAVAAVPDSSRVWRLVLFGVNPPSDPVRLTTASHAETQNAGISPDGKWLTYDADESGDRRQIYAEPFPLTGHRIQVTNRGGAEAQWSRRGDALFYRVDNQIVRVPYTAGAQNPFGTPKVFVEGPFAEFTGRTYSLHPDGKRVLVKVLSHEQTSREIRVHTDLLAELRRLESAASAPSRP
jgi:Tol biopolymer transport system component